MKWQLSQRGRIATVFAFVFAASFLFSHTAFAATYYLAINGNDSNSCATAQSIGTPKKTFSSLWGCLSAGDTASIGDGTYTTVSPPTGKAGSSGAYITVQAQNEGAVVLSGGMDLRNNSYLEFYGFKFVSSGTPLSAHSNGAGLVTHHVTFRRCGFNTNSTAEDGGIDLYDGTHHMLFEDFWAWGGGRYSIALYGGPGGNPPNTTADYNTFRRGVIRQGPAYSSGGNPEASLALYYASNNIIENVIALDGNQDSDSSNSAFYLTGHAPPPNTSDNKFYGVIALNNKGAGFYLDVDNNEYAQNNAVYNSVFWKHPDGGVQLYANNASRCTGTIIDHIVAGENNNEGFWNYCNGTVVKSSIFQHNTTYGMNQGLQGSMGTHNWNLLYNNTSGNYNNMTAGANDKTVDPGLKYIVRIESGSACSGAGEGGSDCGANITKRYQDGVLTTNDLWPWPYEDRIKKEMCTDTGVTTGFCAKSSLTSYIWEYLGNPCPTGICTSTPDTASPTSPTSLAASATSSSSITVSWTASTDNIGVTSYQVERCTGLSCSTFTQVGTPTSSPFVDSGLTASTGYSYHIRALDAAGNMSSWSNVVGATTQSATSAPSFTLSANPTSITSGASSTLIWSAVTNAESCTASGGTFTGSKATSGGTQSVSPTSTTIYTLSCIGTGGTTNQSATVTVAAAGNCSPVSTRCVDDTAGTNQEYSTIQAAITAAVAGDTVLVFDGNYAGFQVAKNGTSGNPITIKANGSGAVITSPVTVSGESDGIYINNANHVVIEGFSIQNTPYRCIAARGATPTSPMTDIVIRSNTCSGSQHEGFYLSETGNSLIENNTISGSGADGTTRAHGLYLANAGADNTTIRGNTISNMRTADSAGIHMNGDLSVGGDGIISGLLIENNTIFDGQQNGLNMDGVQNSTIRNNLVYNMGNCGARGYQIDAAAGPKNMIFINNTFAVNTGWDVKLTEDGGGNIAFNNVFLSSGGAIAVEAATKIASNYNIVTDMFSKDGDSSTINLISWKTGGDDANSLVSTPSAVFVNSGSGDLHLKTGSLAINFGVAAFSGVSAPLSDIVGSVRPQGTSFDAGAYESLSSGSSASCNTVTTTNFSQSAYNSYGAPFDAFQTSTNLLDAKCTSSDTHTINLTSGVTGDTTRIVYTKGYYYDPVTAGWTQYSGTCNGALNGEWCQGSISATITNPNISTASASNPTYLVGMTCSVQGGGWKCGCRDTTCANFYWQVQGAGQ